jgi:hypothetical protein
VATFAVRVGDHHVGVRTDSERVADLLERRLGRWLVDDPNVPVNISVHRTAPKLGGDRPVLRIYEGCSHLFTATTQERAIEVVATRLQAFYPVGELPRGLVALRMAAVLDETRALLIPTTLLLRDPTLERRLRRDHLEVHPSPLIAVDVPSRQLLTPPPWFDADREAGAPLVGPRRRAIIGLAFESGATGDPPMTRAHALARALTVTARRPGRRELEGLSSVISASAVVELVDDRAVLAIRSLFRATV